MDDLTAICAWCGKWLSGPEDGAEVSHGICQDCLERMTTEVNEYFEDER